MSDQRAHAALTEAVHSGVIDGTTPGAAAVVLTVDGARHLTVAGALHRDVGAFSVDEHTVWDLASLTKLLCTTLLAARAADEGALRLDEEPWPDWPGVTIETVMRHESGLVGWLPLFAGVTRGAMGRTAGRDEVIRQALAVKPEAAPGVSTIYSDVGMIALGALLEERLGRPLDEAFADAARDSWGDTGLRFVRLERDGYHPALPHVAPTERCPWRKRVMQGQVHDENCFAMGGVSAHAGLFGSIEDVERAARFFLSSMTSTLRMFARVPESPTRRPIGFDRISPGGSTGGALSLGSVGHLGFTGCSLWVDPKLEAAIVLLSNRVHPTRENASQSLAFRQRVHRAAADWARARRGHCFA